MHIASIHVLNFKNIAEAQLELHAKCNCFFGKNGMGKTNLLDAIYYMSFTKSYFNANDTQNIQWGHEYFMLQGVYELNETQEELTISQKPGSRKSIKRNKKDYKKFSDHIGRYPLVIISPADVDLIEQGSDTRRKFLDGIISQFDAEYLDRLIQYNKSLQQRNKLLKQFAENGNFDRELLLIYEQQMLAQAQVIYEKRQRFTEDFIPHFQRAYKAISGENESVSLKYDSKLHHADLSQLFEESLAKDRILKYTSCGIHKDDLDFLIESHPIKKFGSQGQKKTYLISMKFAQFHFMKQLTGKIPLLLLDDIFDKLDEHRVAAIIEMIHKPDYGQIFITDTEIGRLKKIFENNKEAFFFQVENGNFEKA